MKSAKVEGEETYEAQGRATTSKSPSQHSRHQGAKRAQYEGGRDCNEAGAMGTRAHVFS